ncbi:MAG: hypothetical protein J6Y62_00590 [Clostridia bacterium]|nr:hypothetical protein [Clostridia bacterium]
MTEEYEIREARLDSLTVPEYCKRKHTEEQVARCIKGLERNGQYQPIIVSGDEIVCGVLVYSALKKMGRETVMVHDLGPLPLEKKKEIRYLDNQIFDIETWDEFKIKDLLMSLPKLGVEKAGFSEEEVELFVNKEPPDPKGGSKRDRLFHDLLQCDSCGWTGTIDDLRKRQ